MIRLHLKILFLLSILFPLTGSAQLSRGGNPRRTGAEISQQEWIRLDRVRTDELILEDAWQAMTGKKSQRFAQEIRCDLHPANSGTWTKLADGTRIWQAALQGEGALSLGLVFNRYHLLPGVRLFVFDPGGEQILGAYTDLNNKASEILAIQYLKGDKAIIQLEIPAGAIEYGDLQLGSVLQAYRPLFEDKSETDELFGLAGSCNVDINCSEGANWQMTKRSIVRLLGGERCSGVLINNTRQDGKAYVLTAAHCLFNKLNGQLNSTVFYFNYESPTCDGPDGIDNHTISGARLLATGDTNESEIDMDSLDFALLELSLAPPDSFAAYFAGWNRSSTAPLNTTTLHHPKGDVLKISVDNDPPVTTYHHEPYLPDLVHGSFWRIVNWEVGTTEGGSSGGPLFDQNQQIVGTLTGGEAWCTNSVNDYFTRLDYAWDYYPDSLRQLKYWLDPVNSGVMTLDALDPLGIPGRESEGKHLSVYPNPVNSMLTVEIPDARRKMAEIRIFNTAGILVFIETREINIRTRISAEKLPPGLYIIQLATDDSVSSERFIKSR